MKGYDAYVFILCFIVFTLLVATFSYAIYLLISMKLRMIRHGLEDEEIKREEDKKAKASRGAAIAGTAVSLLVCVALLAAFIFSLYMNFSVDKRPNGVPSLKVVQSGSMASKNEKNTYLEKNDLNDQIQTFDIIVTHHLPAEEDLELYDIVVYKMDDRYVVHRIVAIEEPNERHPDCRHFLLQGDAVVNPDPFPVLYSQMQGIYLGERIAFVGSFVMFMQSPAGWLCIILVIFAIAIMPFLEKKLSDEKAARLRAIGYTPYGSDKKKGWW